MFQSIKVNELKKLNNINLIDIRSIEKYNNRHIDRKKKIVFEINKKVLIHFLLA